MKTLTPTVQNGPITLDRLEAAFGEIAEFFQADTDAKAMAFYTCALADAGIVEILDYAPVIILVTPQTKYVLKTEFLLDPGPHNPFTIRKSLQNFVDDLALGSSFHKIEGRTPNRRMAMLLKAFGAKLEGVREESVLVSGSWQKEYDLGYILRR